jgi:ribosome-associated heat shock protein Hsp15
LRIDLYLHRIRLAKSRTQAQALVDQGTARIDGKRIEKPSEAVRGRVRVIRVLALPGRRGPPSEARAAYEEIDGETAAT